MLEILSVPINVTLFGNWAFFLWTHRKKGNLYRDTGTQGKCHMKTEAETRVMCL
jgi:hypothetical protein